TTHAAAATCSKLVVLKENVHGPLRSGHRLEPKLQEDGFEVNDPPRDAVLDNVDFPGKELINHVNDRLGVLLADPFRIAALPFLPLCPLRRPAIADLVARWVLHRLTRLTSVGGANICPVMVGFRLGTMLTAKSSRRLGRAPFGNWLPARGRREGSSCHEPL